MRYLIILIFTCAVFARENPLAGILGPENLKRAQATGVDISAGDRPDSVVLRFSPGVAGALRIPVPAAGRDWTHAGAFTFEFSSNSTIRWELEIRNGQGKTFIYRVQPYQDVPVRASIAQSWLAREYMNNHSFRGHWLSNWSNHIDLSEVESLTVRMNPNRAVTLRLGPLALAEGEETDEVFLARPVVDEFGQWAPLEWPGKVHSLAELRAAWSAEDSALVKAQDVGYSRFGGWRGHQERATGFFHTAQIDGRWWLVDPEGHLFFSTGPDCVRYKDPTPITGRETLFAKLPPGAGSSADFYRANASLRYSEAEFIPNWKAKTAQRLRAWGFNTVANWSDPAMFDRPSVPFVTDVSVGRFAKGWQRFPDVYSPAFVRAAEADAARQCDRYRDEPYLIGYFIGNEPRWPGRNLLDLILADAEPSDTQSFVRKYLQERGDTSAARDALMETISRRYFRTVSDAIRKADPNHMVLGIRWAGSAPEPVLKANDVFDVFSINIYRFEPAREQVERIYSLVRRPILIGEFHFGAAERGYAPSLVMVKDQTERGVAYQYYLERAAALAPVVGAHYFQWVDQPVSGRYDGENYNLGFVTQTDLPYPEMVSFARAAHRRIYAVHAGTEPPVARAPKVN